MSSHSSSLPCLVHYNLILSLTMRQLHTSKVYKTNGSHERSDDDKINLTFSCSLLHTVKLLTWIVGKGLTPWLQDSKGPCAHGVFLGGAEKRWRCTGALGWRVERKNKLHVNLVSVTTISWLCSVPVWWLASFTLKAAKSSRASTRRPWWIPLWSEVLVPDKLLGHWLHS